MAAGLFPWGPLFYAAEEARDPVPRRPPRRSLVEGGARGAQLEGQHPLEVGKERGALTRLGNRQRQSRAVLGGGGPDQRVLRPAAATAYIDLSRATLYRLEHAGVLPARSSGQGLSAQARSGLFTGGYLLWYSRSTRFSSLTTAAFVPPPARAITAKAIACK